MKTYDTPEAIVKAIMDCPDKKETERAITSILRLAIRDKSMRDDSKPEDTLSGHVMLSTMILSVKNM